MTDQSRRPALETLTWGVVASVAEQAGVEETTLPPLYEAVDATALNALFTHSTEPEDVGLTVAFQYAGYNVSVDPEGTVTIG